MNWIKKKILHWLGVDAQIESLQKEVTRIKREHDSYVNRTIRLHKDVRFCKSMMSFGLDHHLRQPSWMVVCMRCGKQERVKFYEIPDNQISTISKMFEDWDHDRIVIDCHPTFRSPMLHYF